MMVMRQGSLAGEGLAQWPSRCRFQDQTPTSAGIMSGMSTYLFPLLALVQREDGLPETTATRFIGSAKSHRSEACCS
jgi:hypothetical protein